MRFGAIKTLATDQRSEISGNQATWLHLIDQNRTVITFSNTNAADINRMREKFVLTTLDQRVKLPAFQLTKAAAVADDFEQLQRMREIDLRPPPNSEPYLKGFVISRVEGKR